MNFQQLRIIRETARRNFNLTEVADALATSQSGVSKHIKDMEDELGVELFIRRGKRFLGLTEAGQQVLEHVERILTDTGNIRKLADELRQSEQGELVVATTHTQARYALPKVIAAFRKAFPDVRLALHQTSPVEIARMLLEGRADIGVATEAVSQHPDLAAFPYYSWHHVVIVPKGHPLEKVERVSLEDIAAHPVITYNEGFTGRPAIDRAFAAAGVQPNIVMAALDADVIKAYVELGMGIGIVASMSVDAERDTQLAVLATDHLFGDSTSHIALRRGRFVRGYIYRFLELCRADLDEKSVRKRLQPDL